MSTESPLLTPCPLSMDGEGVERGMEGEGAFAPIAICELKN